MTEDPQADGPQMPEPVAWACLTASGRIAYFDGRPMVMPGPVGNEVHPAPLITTAAAHAYAEAMAAHRVALAVAAERERCTDAVMHELDRNGQAEAIVQRRSHDECA